MEFRRRAIVAAISIAALLTIQVGPAIAAHKRPAESMTYNVYLGGDLAPVLAAQTLPQAVVAATGVYLQVVNNDFAARAESIADRIGESRPTLIGLQEVSLWRTDTPADGPATPAEVVTFDFLEILLDTLEERGLHYEAVSVVENFDGEVPTALGFDARLTDRDVILARTDLRKSRLKLSKPRAGHYENNLVIESPALGRLEILRGWATIDAKVRGKKYRFVNTHLEAFSAVAQVAQAQELLDGPADARIPVVMVGDFNSFADGSTTPTYQMLLDDGFTDAWSRARPAEPGYTCCQAADLRNGTSLLDERIDLVLFRGKGFRADEAEVVGDEPEERTPSGLWPSDHAGVYADLSF
jgi:endonuclease/exonuclease/phosphatase family metal-dependent hydrolase